MIQILKKNLLAIWQFFYYKRSYSQDGEDVVLSSFFETRRRYRGFFVDVGAHHPVRFSNTCLFYKNGWRGINIDPTPGSMRPFKVLRKKDINIEMGIGPTVTEMNFYCFNEPALNTFDDQLAQIRSQISSYKIINTIMIPVKPLKMILDEYLPINTKIDFLTIDVEGLDLEVLKSNDWSKYKPEFILVEDVDFQIENPTKSDIFCFLKKEGYKIVASLKRTIIYRL
jgi:FkbM family methyltransferase